MSVFHALLLSILEGFTEFLPISSTGHLILASRIMGITTTEFTKSFEIAIQLGAILAIVVLYSKKIGRNPSVLKPIFFAFLPTAAVGLALYKIIKTYLLGNTLITILALAIGGIVLIAVDAIFKGKKERISGLSKISLPMAVCIGFAQVVSVVPGVSRAAATIVGAMTLGLSKETAIEFSFLLAIPTIVAATALDLAKTSWSFTPNQLTLLAVGTIGSFVSAMLSIRFYLSFIKNRSFTLFGIYRILLALGFWFFVGVA